MKKLVALILCAAMCLSFAGCGGEEAPASTPAGSSGAEETSVSGEIEILLHKVEINEIMNTMIEEFNKEYPDVKVVLNAPGDTGTVLQARAVANDMPDIVTFPYNNSDLAYARDGFYMDLTNEAFMQENVTPAALESNKVDGANYFLPYISNAYGVYYNVDIFEENGIEIPTTMDELYAACEKLQAAGVTPIAFSDQELWTLGHLGDRLMGLIFDDDGTLFQQIAAGEATATEHEGMRTVAEVYLKLHEYGQPDSLGVGYEQAISAFANGEAAMMLQGTWLLSLVKSANPDMNVDVFPLPGMTAEETRVGINMDLGLAISETSENKKRLWPSWPGCPRPRMLRSLPTWRVLPLCSTAWKWRPPSLPKWRSSSVKARASSSRAVIGRLPWSMSCRTLCSVWFPARTWISS